jgi:hypothetical protein
MVAPTSYPHFQMRYCSSLGCSCSQLRFGDKPKSARTGTIYFCKRVATKSWKTFVSHSGSKGSTFPLKPTSSSLWTGEQCSNTDHSWSSMVSTHARWCTRGVDWVIHLWCNLYLKSTLISILGSSLMENAFQYTLYLTLRGSCLKQKMCFRKEIKRAAGWINSIRTCSQELTQSIMMSSQSHSMWIQLSTCILSRWGGKHSFQSISRMTQQQQTIWICIGQVTSLMEQWMNKVRQST